MNKKHTKGFTLLPNLLSLAFCTNIVNDSILVIVILLQKDIYSSCYFCHVSVNALNIAMTHSVVALCRL